MLEEIHKKVNTPLVLHGGSGLSGTDFQTAIAHGISKINIFTDINIAAASAAAKALADGKTAMTDIIPYQVEAVAEATKAKMELFGCVGRG